MALGDGKRGTVRRVTQMENKDRILAVHKLEHFPIAVSVGMDVHAALGDWRREAKFLMAGAGLFAAVIIVLVLLGVRQIRSQELLAHTRAEKAEAEAARALAETELLKKARFSTLGQLTATVAHELRNPLSAIRNTVPVLRETTAAMKAQLDRPLSRIERSIGRCDQLVSSLLEYTRSRELIRRPISFDDWLGEVLNEQQVPADIALERDFSAPDVALELDGERFRRVIINLVDNAAQAIATSEVPLPQRKIIVSTRASERFEIAIRDTGPGIAPEVLPRIFEPLFSTKSFGTGLGLPTVKQIVEYHDGKIVVESTPGHGTTVRISLPRPVQLEDAA